MTVGNKIRIAFPVTMFVLAGISFSYGAYQHFSARSVRDVDEQRLAFILETIEQSNFSDVRKQELYVSIAAELPTSVPVLGIDFSGSFAAPTGGDSCENDGQRTLCRALRTQRSDPATISAVCGACDPPIDMINEKYKLRFDSDVSKVELEPTRDGYGKGLVQAGEKDERVVMLCADLTESTRSHWFAEKFPERYIQVGVAEQNLAVLASGMAAYGKIPFIASYATFSPGRNNEQIRTTICINDVPVKVVGSHAGISVGPDGATHQALEDMALMRSVPRMVVIVPVDAPQAQKATMAAAFNGKPTYLRLGREKMPVFTTEDTPFTIGKAQIFRDGSDVAIIACGSQVYDALVAAEELATKGIECMVVNNHTVKPLDEETIVKAAKKCGRVVTVEEHQVAAGMGSAVAECLARKNPVPIEFVGMQDRFGESGNPRELLAYFGLDAAGIKKAVLKVLERKKKRTAKKK